MKKPKSILEVNDGKLRELYKKVYLEKDGYKCVTCGCFTDCLEVGHCYTRGNRAVRYHFHNTAPQCRKCNSRRNGERKFYQWMIGYRFGVNVFYDLLKAKNSVGRPDLMLNISDELDYISQENITHKEFMNRIGQKKPIPSFEEIKEIKEIKEWEKEWTKMLYHL